MCHPGCDVLLSRKSSSAQALDELVSICVIQAAMYFYPENVSAPQHDHITQAVMLLAPCKA